MDGDRYELLEEIGGGATGTVFRAHDRLLEREVALKFLARRLSRDRNAKARFHREARLAANLDHSNICAIHDFGETEGGKLFIAMTFCEGETVGTRLDRGPLPLGECVDIVTQATRGLMHAHGQGVVHRDIQPHNLIITEAGAVKIVDFGLARASEEVESGRLTETGLIIGTPYYVSPERIRGERVDHRTDIWSLGVVLYEMVTGHHAFWHKHPLKSFLLILHRQPEPVRSLRPDAPAEMVEVIDRALSKDPDDRFADCGEMLTALDSARRAVEGWTEEPLVTPMKDAAVSGGHNGWWRRVWGGRER